MNNRFSLSADEMALVQNAGWIITKRRVIEKVYELFGQLSETYTLSLQEAGHIPSEVKAVSPKIYKGESYQQLPYVLLDHPRFFKGTDAFAIRSFFWWGNSFSIHLHLAGQYKIQFQQQLLQQLQAGRIDNWFSVIAEDAWQHHFEPDNYLPVQPGNYEQVTTAWQQRDFIKLGQHYPIANWDTAAHFYNTAFYSLLQFLTVI
jgi:hypothetical protein